MSEVKKIEGILNTDFDIGEVLPNEHVDARNVVFRDGRMQNIKGSRLIANALPVGGFNKFHGKYFDQLHQRLFYFNYNSTGKSGIYFLDIKTEVVHPLLVSFVNSTVDIFDFDIDFPIEYVDILYTTEEDGDILHWTDRKNRPMKLNIKDAIDNIYGATWVKSYLTVARPMPLISPICSFKNDASLLINNFRKRIYQFRYLWLYKDFNSSTYSPYSKIFTPFNPDDLAINIDETKNNKVEVTVETGDATVAKIQILARVILEDGSLSDDLIIDTLDKSELIIGDNSTYLYTFLNDGVYQYADKMLSILLFFYVPKKANAQAILNGNVLDYAGITEGVTYDETQNVTVEVVPATSEGGDPYIVTEQTFGRAKAFYFTGTPQTGDETRLTVIDADNSITYNAFYATGVGETTTDIRDYFSAYYDADPDLTVIDITDGSGNPGIKVSKGLDFLTGSANVVYATLPTTTDVGIASYRPLSKYPFGRVYFDEFGETNGVVTNSIMNILTNEIDNTGDTEPSISAIQFTVNDRPPIWAKTFSFVRGENATAKNNVFFVSADTDHDTTVGQTDFGYLNITNLQKNTEGYSAYEYVLGDRIRIIGEYSEPFVAVKDYPIISVNVAPKINGADKAAGSTWIKIPYDVASMSNWGTVGYENYYFEIYTPVANVSDSETAYYEFGETYRVLNPGTANRYHEGQIQTQTAVIPAIYSFARGDYYLRKRTIPISADLSVTKTMWLFSQSISDKYFSKTTGNGRPFTIDPYAKETYYPTLNRFSLDYEQGTSVNRTNQFYPANFDEYDRQRGDVMGLNVAGNRLHVFQKRGCGMCGINETLLSNADGSTNLIRTDKILNPIHYYTGNNGVGDQYTALVRTSTNSYFSDPITGEQCRLSLSGLDVISRQNKGQYYLSDLIDAYSSDWVRPDGSKARILGFFDYSENQFVTILQGGTSAIEGDEAAIFDNTFAFKERVKWEPSYTAFYDIYAEGMASVNNINYGWLNGQLHKFDSNTTNNFFGVQYGASITIPFNKDQVRKKGFQSLAMQGNVAWPCSIIYTNMFSYAGQRQESNLVASDFRYSKGWWQAKLQRDINSIGGISNGDKLKGNWIVVKFHIANASNFVYIEIVEMKYTDQHLMPS